MKDKQQEIELGYEKSENIHRMDLHKEMLGKPVWVVRPPHKTTGLPWKGTVTRVVDTETFLVKRFGNGIEEEVDMYDIRSVKKKARV